MNDDGSGIKNHGSIDPPDQTSKNRQKKVSLFETIGALEFEPMPTNLKNLHISAASAATQC
jgi:hypothetical protein